MLKVCQELRLTIEPNLRLYNAALDIILNFGGDFLVFIVVS